MADCSLKFHSVACQSGWISFHYKRSGCILCIDHASHRHAAPVCRLSWITNSV